MFHLADKLRDALGSARPTDFIPEITSLVHSYVAELSSFSSGPNAMGLDESLQKVLQNDIDQRSVPHIHLVLATLDALDKTVSTQSIISSWFDLLLRPSLKSRQLPDSAQQHIRNVVLRVMHDPAPAVQDNVFGFRRRIMELFLLDTSSISSRTELVDKMTWTELERLQHVSYKTNLETILADFFEMNTQEFVALYEKSFEEPKWRLQLVLLLKRIVTSEREYKAESMRLIMENILPKLVKSLLIDTSSTLFDVTLSLCVQILPHLLLQSPDQVPTVVPMLFLILNRGLCWAQHPRFRTQSWPHNPRLKAFPVEVKQSIDAIEGTDDEDSQESGDPSLRSSISWEILGTTFDSAGMEPPSPVSLLQFLLGLFPSNTLMFLRSPKSYIEKHSPQELYTFKWVELIDASLLKQRAAPLLQRFRIPAALLLFDDSSHLEELIDVSRWKNCSIANIVGTCALLEVTAPTESQTSFVPMLTEISTDSISQRYEFVISDGKDSESQKLGNPIIDAAGYDRNLEQSSLLITDGPENHTPQVVQAISSLQRENLLLKNELNFELWLKAQRTAHTCLLHRESKKLRLESESESLRRHKTMQKYRRRYAEVQAEFKAHKEQASSSISELKTWNKTQEDKVAEMRKKERAWLIEASSLKEKIQLKEASILAQNKLLEKAQGKIFHLDTEMKAIKPKIDRVQDFEARANQLEKLQKVWEDDVERFNSQSDQMRSLIESHKYMSLKLQSLEAANSELQSKIRSLSIQQTRSTPSARTSKVSQEFVESLINQIRELKPANNP